MEKEKNNALVISEKERLINGLNDINTKLSKFKELKEGKVFLTDGKFKWNPKFQGVDVNIHQCKDLSVLLEIDGALTIKKESYDNAATKRNISTYPAYTWLGYSYKQWENDLSIMIGLVTHKEVYDNLLRDKKELEEFLDKEDRMKIKLDKLGY